MNKFDKFISDYFNDPATGFVSAEALYKKIKLIKPEIKLADVRRVLKSEYTAQVNQPQRKATEYSSIFSPAPKNNYQIDIMVYDRYAYNGYKYILCIIDVYSRSAECIAMTNRNMSTIITAVKKVFSEMGVPKNMNGDNEFTKKEFNDLMKSYGVTMYYSQPDEINKNAIVERFNRTIAEKIQLWRTATGKYDWQKVLPKLVDNYNTTVHKSTKRTPFDLFYHKAVTEQERKIIEHKLKLGEKVRVIIHKKTFDKNDVLKYSKDIFMVNRINKGKIFVTNMRTQEEDDRHYKAYELKPVNEITIRPNDEDEEQKHQEIQVERKNKKAMAKEGVEANLVAPRRTERIRKPVNLLVDSKGSFVKY